MAKADGEGTDAVAAPPDPAEAAACVPAPVNPAWFNPAATYPYSCTAEQVRLAMSEFLNFLGFINATLHDRGIIRFESLLSQASFSSVVGEYMVSKLPEFCPTLVKNRFHNGHPDLLPAGMFPDDAIKHATEGVEVKGSRATSGWQGHNPERCWLMVFVYDSNKPPDIGSTVPPRPFEYRSVYLARLEKEDWKFAGRIGASKRTITASVSGTGRAKLVANWVYNRGGLAPGVRPPQPPSVKPATPRRRARPPG